MNYARIYAEFIRDRLHKQPEKPEYFEVHHIKPRCLGGDDEPDNLIRLTPEDHYFAHMLLAHAHGGKMWLAAMAMARLTVGKRKVKRLQQRGTYGIARRKAAEWFSENMSGENSPTADKTVYTLRHKDGREVTGRRFELVKSTGVSQGKLSALLLGNTVTASKWFDVRVASDWIGIQKVLRARWSKNKTVRALYREDGATWTGVSADFAAKFGGQLHFQSKFGHCKGWFRSPDHVEKWKLGEIRKQQIATDARGDISGHNNPRADKTKYKFVNLGTGMEYELTRVEMRSISGASVSHIQRLVSGQLHRIGAWAMVGTSIKRQRGAIYRFVHEDGSEIIGSKNAIRIKIGSDARTIEKMVATGSSIKGWKWDGAQPSY